MLKNPRSLLLTFLQWKAVKVNENFTFNDWQEMCLLFSLIPKLSNCMSKVMSHIHLHSTEQKWTATKWDWLLIIHCQWSSQKRYKTEKLFTFPVGVPFDEFCPTDFQKSWMRCSKCPKLVAGSHECFTHRTL